MPGARSEAAIDNYEVDWDRWVASATEGENRAEAVSRLKEAVRALSENLLHGVIRNFIINIDLSNLGLTSLPPNLKALNPIFQGCAKEVNLSIDNNKLINLDELNGVIWPNLGYLSIRENALDNISGLLRANFLNLKRLWFSGARVLLLPQLIIRNPRFASLTTLGLEECNIRDLTGLARNELPLLRELILAGNRDLLFIPEELSVLPAECNVIITDTGIPKTEVSSFLSHPQRASRPNIISHNNGNTRTGKITRSLADAVHDWQIGDTAFSRQSWDRIYTCRYSSDFSYFLDALRIAVGRRFNEFQAEMSEILNALLQNKLFRNTTFLTVASAIHNNDLEVFTLEKIRQNKILADVISGLYNGNIKDLIALARKNSFRDALQIKVQATFKARNANASRDLLSTAAVEAPVQNFIQQNPVQLEIEDLANLNINFRAAALPPQTPESGYLTPVRADGINHNKLVNEVRQAENTEFIKYLAKWEPWEAFIRKEVPSLYEEMIKNLDQKWSSRPRVGHDGLDEIKTSYLINLTKTFLNECGQIHLLEPVWGMDRDIEPWTTPSVNMHPSEIEETGSNYKKQFILQVDSSKQSAEAAFALTDKHRSISRWVQLRDAGALTVAANSTSALEPFDATTFWRGLENGDSLRVTLIGHSGKIGNTHVLGGKSMQMLGEQFNHLLSNKPDGLSVKLVLNVASCDVFNAASWKGGLVHKLGAELIKSAKAHNFPIENIEIHARAHDLTVDAQGRKKIFAFDKFISRFSNKRDIPHKVILVPMQIENGAQAEPTYELILQNMTEEQFEELRASSLPSHSKLALGRTSLEELAVGVNSYLELAKTRDAIVSRLLTPEEINAGFAVIDDTARVTARSITDSASSDIAEVMVINKDGQQSRSIACTEQDSINFHKFAKFSKEIATAAHPYLHSNAYTRKLEWYLPETEGANTMALFALFQFFQSLNIENLSQASLALKIQMASMGGQIALGLIAEAAAFANAWRNAYQVAVNAELTQLPRGFGSGVSVVNIGFDIVNLATAIKLLNEAGNNPIIRAQAITQISIFAAQLGVDIAILVAAIVASEAVPILSVPAQVLAALAIGAVSLVGNLMESTALFESTANYFDWLGQAVLNPGFQISDGIAHLAAGAVVLKLDLKRGRLHYGNVHMTGTQANSGSAHTVNIWGRDVYFATPDFDAEGRGGEIKFLDLYTDLGFNKEQSFIVARGDIKPILLPGAAQRNISLRYGIVDSDRSGHRVYKELRDHDGSRFVYAYNALFSGYGINSHIDRLLDTPIVVILDSYESNLILQTVLNQNERNCISYTIYGAGAACNLSLALEPLRVSLEGIDEHGRKTNNEWRIHIGQAIRSYRVGTDGQITLGDLKHGSIENIKVQGNSLQIAEHRIHFSGSKPKALSLIDVIATDIVLNIQVDLTHLEDTLNIFSATNQILKAAISVKEINVDTFSKIFIYFSSTGYTGITKNNLLPIFGENKNAILNLAKNVGFVAEYKSDLKISRILLWGYNRQCLLWSMRAQIKVISTEDGQAIRYLGQLGDAANPHCLFVSRSYNFTPKFDFTPDPQFWRPSQELFTVEALEINKARIEDFASYINLEPINSEITSHWLSSQFTGEWSLVNHQQLDRPELAANATIRINTIDSKILYFHQANFIAHFVKAEWKSALASYKLENIQNQWQCNIKNISPHRELSLSTSDLLEINFLPEVLLTLESSVKTLKLSANFIEKSSRISILRQGDSAFKVEITEDKDGYSWAADGQDFVLFTKNGKQIRLFGVQNNSDRLRSIGLRLLENGEYKTFTLARIQENWVKNNIFEQARSTLEQNRHDALFMDLPDENLLAVTVPLSQAVHERASLTSLPLVLQSSILQHEEIPVVAVTSFDASLIQAIGGINSDIFVPANISHQEIALDRSTNMISYIPPLSLAI